MSDIICHDIKTPRLDASKRLAPYWAVTPVAFYVMLIFCAYTNITAYLGYRKALQDRDTWKAYQAEQRKAKEKYETEKNAVLKEKARAEKLAQWIEGTRTIQPITVAIARSVPVESTIGQLSLERSVDLPSQIILTLTINNGTVEDVSRVQQNISNLSYHPFNAQQNHTGDLLEYKTMLVWQQM
jgi:hypothetical protein